MSYFYDFGLDKEDTYKNIFNVQVSNLSNFDIIKHIFIRCDIHQTKVLNNNNFLN